MLLGSPVVAHTEHNHAQLHPKKGKVRERINGQIVEPGNRCLSHLQTGHSVLQAQLVSPSCSALSGWRDIGDHPGQTVIATLDRGRPRDSFAGDHTLFYLRNIHRPRCLPSRIKHHTKQLRHFFIFN